ncbi:hypothetical protein LCGC14_1409140 [marine sediment metagenome]|uniref:Uncharacterized protein n=1 Tax=marine sediment metagenome TaxID=412755 RepID=A0A0F9JV21_9ZZZZ
MNQSDRDILLKLSTNQGSLLEQNKSIIRELQDHNRHSEKTNGYIQELFVGQATQKGGIKRNWLFIRIAGSILGILLSGIIALQFFT